MSIILKLDDLTNDDINIITKELTIYPFDKYEEELKLRGMINKFPSKPIPPISMFIPDPITRTVKVPYFFGCNMKEDKKGNKINKKFNYKNNFAKVKKDAEEWEAHLLEN